MLCASLICVRSEFRNEEDILCIKVESRVAAGETGGEMLYDEGQCFVNPKCSISRTLKI